MPGSGRDPPPKPADPPPADKLDAQSELTLFLLKTAGPQGMDDELRALLRDELKEQFAHVGGGWSASPKSYEALMRRGLK